MSVELKVGKEVYRKKGTVSDMLTAMEYAEKMGNATSEAQQVVSIIDWGVDFFGPCGLKKEEILDMPSDDFTMIIDGLMQAFTELVGGDEEEAKDKKNKKK